MKLSTSVNFLFSELPFLERFEAAKKAGFAGVEIQLMEAEATQVATAIADSGVQPVLINADMGDLMKGGPGLSGVPGREQQFQQAARQAAENAALLGVPMVHLGPCRVMGDTTREACLDTYRRNIDYVLSLEVFASGASMPMLEPMNNVDLPDALFTDVYEAAAMLTSEFDGKVGLQFDIYHVAKAGQDVLQAWHRLQQQVGHVQFSDVPDRTQPGTGSVDFAAVFGAIRDSDYDGWVGAEYFPTNGTDNSLGWMSDAQ